jgi:hypothetical protein
LGKHDEESKKQFGDLYDFRCDLVHGNVPEKEAYMGHLREARDLARRTLVWFLYYLDHIQAVIAKDQSNVSLPSREDLLKLIDQDKETRNRLDWLTKNLPEGFPYVREWMK